MKLVIRQYLESLKERGELDAILPDLLSEMGWEIVSHPTRGTRQYGVDVAAISPPGEAGRRLHLFSIKQGDLGRNDWNSTDQALRPSLDEIQDVYIRNRIVPAHADLPVVICLCFGGEVHEGLRETVAAYMARHTTDRVSFEEWNGDRIAGLLVDRLFREETLPRGLRTSFQKAVAMVDEPDIALEHYRRLLHELTIGEGWGEAERVTRARQVYISLWVLFVWGRDIGNVEAAYVASELALLHVWQMSRDFIGAARRTAIDLGTVVSELVQLHFMIWDELIGRKVLPHAGTSHGVSMAVASASPVDVNLRMFDLLGRIALRGLWMHWFEQRDATVPVLGLTPTPEMDALARNLISLVEANPVLLSPISDDQTIDLTLAFMFLAIHGSCNQAISDWIDAIVDRSVLAYRLHRRYPTSNRRYRDLIQHPRERTDEYRREATSAGTLWPVLGAWAAGSPDGTVLPSIAQFVETELGHCNLQLWYPDADTEDRFLTGDVDHGRALSDVPVVDGAAALLARIAEEGQADDAFDRLSTVAAEHWPLLLIACRLYRLPVPPQLWIGLVGDATPATSSEPAP